MNKNAAKITKIAEFWYENLHMSDFFSTFALEIRNELITTILITKNLAMIQGNRLFL